MQNYFGAFISANSIHTIPTQHTIPTKVGISIFTPHNFAVLFSSWNSQNKGHANIKGFMVYCVCDSVSNAGSAAGTIECRNLWKSGPSLLWIGAVVNGSWTGPNADNWLLSWPSYEDNKGRASTVREAWPSCGKNSVYRSHTSGPSLSSWHSA